MLVNQRRLQATGLLDTPREPVFDQLVQAAAAICGTAMAALCLVDADRQWFKACQGEMPGELPRAHSPCALAVAGSEALLQLVDARREAGLADGPLVRQAPFLRFYAGAVLVMPGGERLGTLCVFDPAPRAGLTPAQQQALLALAAQAVQTILLHEQMRAREREARRELVEGQLFLESAAGMCGVGAWRVDTEPAPRLYWSAQTCRIHDLSPEHRPRLEDLLSFYAPAERAEVAAALERCFATGDAFEYELPLVTARGRELWVRVTGLGQLENGRVTRLLGAVQDVTPRRRLQERLRLLYEQTPALLLSLDEQGRIGACTDRLAQRLGVDRERLIGSRLADWMHPAAASAWQHEQLPLLLHKGRLDNQPCQLRTEEGVLLQVLLSALRERAGDPPRVLVALEDITESQRRGQQLAQEQRRRARVEHEARDLAGLLEERSEMLNVLAHEVRQPLNNASAALQHALVGLHEAAAAEPLRRAQRVLGRVMAGVDNTLAAAALIAGQGQVDLADVDVDLLVAIAIGDMAAEDRARVTVQRESDLRTVIADLGLMRLALRNLLANALGFSPRGAPVQLRLADEGDALLIEVHDQGPGVAEAVRPLLFQRGARGPLHERRGSHGLGLYIVRRAMELQGGSARLLFSSAIGSAFQLRLGVDSSGARNT